MAERGQSTGVLLEFERTAMNGDPMPEGLPLEDQAMFQALSLLYARYRRGEITRDMASGEKGKLLFEYDRRKRMAKAAADLAGWHTRVRSEVEGAQCRYRKERTPEAADALSDALDGRMGRRCREDES